MICTGCDCHCEPAPVGLNPECFVPDIKEYLSHIGRQGGKAKGRRKSRGDSDYYRDLARKAVEARRKKSP